MSDSVRPALIRCLSGELSPAMTLMHLLIETESVTRITEWLDKARSLTETDVYWDEAAALRLEQLGRMLYDNEQGVAHCADVAPRHGPQPDNCFAGSGYRVL